jgi:uncharacterized phage protein (TIGR01671 family)
MTPLRFRAWLTEVNRMTDSGGTPTMISGFFSHLAPAIVQDKALVMQSTGLKDKNGVEIFEGDICKASKPNSYLDGVYEVVWHETKGQWFYKGQPSYKPLYQVGCAGNLQCEVIGNIHQNPDLLTPAA